MSSSKRPSPEPPNRQSAAPSRTHTPLARPGSSRPSPIPRTPPPNAAPEGRPLNVTDALSYLDAVKIQFQDKPDVYNHFLDIMKDFKSQAIDTPGVIERVSTLFNGNPELIQGFNTFLPQGYRIDISADPLDPNTITVTTPMGTTIQTTGGPNRNTHLHPAQGPPPSSSRAQTPIGFQQYDQYGANYNNNPQAAAASILGNLREEKQPAEQFNHAITYLNKIKTRFADDASVYKQFLEILQTHQKEQKHLVDSQVYAQIQVLFKDAPDLLGEFKDFLPAIAGGPTTPHESNWNQVEPAGSTYSDSGAEKRSAKRRRKPEPPAPAPAKPVPNNRSRRTKPAAKADSPAYEPYNPPLSPPPPPIPGEMSRRLAGHPNFITPTDRLLFFERAKKALEPKDMYDDFLKLLNMFSSDVVDLRTLVDRAKPFLGEHGQLMGEFMEVVGWFDRGPGEGGPPGSIRMGPPEGLLAPPTDMGQGPSYRRLPESEVRLACSGRDELCRSVLNDLWVSHPTWASEEAGFLAHKKNSFEEALHKSEEERHEYQILLESLARTISLFQPLCERIECMPSEERAAFRLPIDFGGPSKAIYHKVIKKVYGRDAVGAEVIQALQDSPSTAVPVVLNRLKQKDEEWRKAHREWSKTWREVDTRNFYKSLDYQIITFKANDKKAITAKHFVADIQTIKKEQQRSIAMECLEDEDEDEDQEESGSNGMTTKPGGKNRKYSFTHGSVGAQLEFSFEDTAVLQDSLKLVYTFLEHSSAQYTSAERRGIEGFLRSFVPLMCMFSKGEFNAPTTREDGPHINGDAGAGADASRASRSGRRTPLAPGGTSGGVAAGELRKRLLMAAKERREMDHSKSRTGSPSPPPEETEKSSLGSDAHAVDDIWISEVVSSERQEQGDVPAPAPAASAEQMGCRRPFFANTTFYTLIRLIQLLYSRLLLCKKIGSKIAANKYVCFKPNPISTELGLDDPNGPAAVLAQAQEAFGAGKAGEDTNVNVLYQYLLDACEKVFDSEMDQTTFEEHMRWFFKDKAYHVFTIDKLIIAMVKQVQTIIADHKCQELWTLVKLARSAEALGNQDIVRYRREAERHLGQDEHLYRIEWEPTRQVLRLRLVGSDEPSVDEPDGDRWREYMDTYVMDHPTEWVPKRKKKSSRVFLTRYGIVLSSMEWARNRY